MLGILDFWIWSAYLLCILSTIACVAYGLYNWNKGGEDGQKQIMEEKSREKAQEET